MKVRAVAIISLVILIYACTDDASDPQSCDPVDDFDESDVICCETYGIGSGGEPCCHEYERVVATECPNSQTPGGGKRVVEDSCCD
ncbi:MAG: hypothetical protein QNJ97_01730 [Myxococcota bacterium]|nr:hypothetical protein [Myxococcota bacterium]